MQKPKGPSENQGGASAPVDESGVAGDGLPPPPMAPPRDWFLAAIEVDGSVGLCLDAVLAELSRRHAFITALKSCLTGKDPRGLDAVSELGVRVKALEKTLRFRLGMLKPERAGAWFRSPAATSTGPFATALLDEPVFGPYEPQDVERVRTGLALAWTERRASNLPFRDPAPNLWRTLLTLQAEWERLCALPEPYGGKQGLRLDRLPDGLPRELESRALRAFLINVRGEVRGTRERLDACHAELTGACAKFWALQRLQQEQASPSSPGAGARTTSERTRAANPTAETLREEFRRRRAAQPRRSLLTPADMEALKVMGFQQLPEPELLRQRYIALAKRLHPDRQGGNDSAFKQLAGAYARLSERVAPQR